MRLFKSQEEKQQIDSARADYDEFIMSAASASPQQAKVLAGSFASKPELVALSDKERARRGADAFRRYAENVLADDCLTADEEDAFTEIARVLGVEQEQFDSTFRDVLRRMVVARANDGRLPEVQSPHLIAKKNEVVHQESAAALMKEVVLREFRGGYSGFSFPIAKGIRYRTGSARGHSVVVGTDMQVEDTGMLTVTSQRIAYMGSRKTMEIPFSKLMNLDVFTDGIRFHASNRQKAPLFKMEEGMGDVIAATINAAIKRFNE
jgi:hypothetical protein